MAALGEKEWREHAALVGAVTLAWNRNVHQMLQVFGHLTGLESPLADAIFFSHQSDKGQRHLVLQAAQAVGLAEPHVKALKKLVERLDKAASGRNLAAHTIFGVTLFDAASGAWGPKVVPALMTPPDKRLEADFTAQFRRVEGQLKAIHDDLAAWIRETPFPDRPWGHPPFPKLYREQIAAQAEAAKLRAPETDGYGGFGA